jgi:hypothetical protein
MFAHLAQIDVEIADIEQMILLKKSGHRVGSTKRYRYNLRGKAGWPAE